MPTRVTNAAFSFLVLAVAAAFGVASAQATTESGTTIVGTIEAAIDGEPVTWYQIEVDSPEGPAPASSYTNIMMTLYDVTLQGFIEPSFSFDRTISINLSLFDGLPEACPCTFADFQASMLYLSGGTLTGDFYTTDEDGGTATVVIELFEPLEDGAYRVEGSFEATLVYVESMSAGADPDDTIRIEGVFVLERLTETTLE